LSRFDEVELIRVWAAATGLLLAACYFVALYAGVKSEMLPMLITPIGGFELFFFGQDVWCRMRARG
jgi:hypothetical protein